MIRSYPFRASLGTRYTLQPRAGARYTKLGPVELQRRVFCKSTRYASEEKSQSFKHQLYESTQQRLKRERAEQERYSEYQTQSQGGRYAAMMFGMRIIHLYETFPLGFIV